MALPLVVVMVAVAAVIPGLGWWVGVLVALIVTGAVIWLRLRDTVGSAVARLGGQPVDESQQARLANLVQGLSLATGVTEPELYVVDDGARNVAPLARGDRSAIVITSGLLSMLDRVSLEAVVAEALVRISSGDAESATLGTALFGPLVSGPVGGLFGPVIASGFRILLAPDRDLVADRAAVELTQYPPGLFAALSEIRAGVAAPTRATRADHHLWMVSPSISGAPGDVVPRTSLDLRMDVLSEL